jgi:hypothetical protein
MKRARRLGWAAIVLFAISQFLPAYGDILGFVCFGVCWNMLLGHDAEILSGGWFYYSGFVISNILFVGLVAALFVRKTSRGLSSVMSVILLLHVFSWLVLQIFQHPSQIAEIKMGYYVWLIAYGLLVAAHLSRLQRERFGAAPLAIAQVGQ